MGTSVEGGFKLAFVGAVHVLMIGMLATNGFRPQLDAAISRLDVRVIEEQPRLQPPRVKPAPLPPRPLATPQVQSAAPAAVMTSAADVATPAQSFTVAPQPSAPIPAPTAKIESAATPPPAQAPAAPIPPVTPPRFDANYLHNPAPAYPRASRLAGQQGQVMLKVLVSERGAAVSVQVQRGSGFARLDDAALEAVRQWRFVPARRGAEAIEDWVLVPIAFRLDA